MGVTEGARRATGVSPGDGCLTTLSVLAYEEPGAMPGCFPGSWPLI